MSEVHVDEHSSPIKTPKQLIVVIVLAFVVPIILIVMLSQLVTSGLDTSKNNPALNEAAVAARIKPVGQVEVSDPNAPKVEKTGKEVVDGACGACHGTGALGAPKIGDRGAWGKLIARGLPDLMASAIKGKGNMPPRGGDATLTDTEIGRAIAFMANQAGAKFVEPASKQAAAPAPKK